MEDQEIRNAGLKVTAPRVKILELLERSDEQHVSAEDVYKMLLAANEDIGLATVYRVLTQFEEAGLVEKHHFEDGYSVFELNKGEHHDHIVCVTCGRVEEFVDDTIENRQKKIADDLGFQISEHELVIYGKCLDDNCNHKR
ncbi:ferric iron uptake transcriptional regulator [Sedimenticola selenatireducens]|uniref:Ferric uptake regulation protein n=1 Tax=Sedimenticola selenatireducens TaxID=191960 RepID=A0A558DS80_9GAMM|nr:ferric iron uptake transcriptional regulator [Sedimenticola selenatireducens]TVO75909.1 ferric iron uptake transcriptional regulator [Sedimenticola selenatireducens]TVT63768.1 MAG: ferric iron uptake transcriptional regulator [Sedimenticola selenatireducens]